jgi:hypothetical protein
MGVAVIPESNVIDLVPWSEPDGRIVYVVPMEAFIHTRTALLPEHWRGIPPIASSLLPQCAYERRRLISAAAVSLVLPLEPSWRRPAASGFQASGGYRQSSCQLELAGAATRSMQLQDAGVAHSGLGYEGIILDF